MFSSLWEVGCRVSVGPEFNIDDLQLKLATVENMNFLWREVLRGWDIGYECVYVEGNISLRAYVGKSTKNLMIAFVFILTLMLIVSLWAVNWIFVINIILSILLVSFSGRLIIGIYLRQLRVAAEDCIGKL